MATVGPVQELRAEASCPICLDYFRDPVSIMECGHNFCRGCLTRSWGGSGDKPSCPQCRRKAQKRKLRPNRQLANFVEIAKKFSPLEEKGAEGKGRVCDKHQEPLKFFCKEDEVPICTVCDVSQEHKDHEVVLLEEAFQGNRFCSCLEILKKKRERILASREDVEKESQDLLKQTTEEKQKTLAKFRQLHKFLEEQETLLLAQMEEVEKEVAKKKDQHLTRFSEELSSLESLIQEMEEKCQQPASDLLQDAQSTLQRYEEKERSENPVTFPLALKWKIWEFCDINHLLEGVMKQLKDNLVSGLHLQKAKVTLDPVTAIASLVLSEDGKSIFDEIIKMEQRKKLSIPDLQRSEDTDAVPDVHSGLPNVTLKMEREDDDPWIPNHQGSAFPGDHSDFPKEMTKVKDEEELWDHQAAEGNTIFPATSSGFPGVKPDLVPQHEQGKRPWIQEQEISGGNEVPEHASEFPVVKVKVEEDEELLVSDVQDYGE
ncbi:UNVERIFIED_CONTAM: hypothetical protein K2H54_061249, partial [Gekko kuhli]